MSCQVSGGGEDKNHSKSQCLCIIACHPVKPLDKVARGLLPWKSRFLTGGKRHQHAFKTISQRIYPSEFKYCMETPTLNILPLVGGRCHPKVFSSPFSRILQTSLLLDLRQGFVSTEQNKNVKLLQAPVLRVFPWPAQQTSPWSHRAQGP